MPEGDTVWLTAHRLHEALAGRVLTRSDVRVPRYATTNLAGRTVTEVAARGKHLLIRVEGGITVHTHLRMDGSWRVRPARERIAQQPPHPARARQRHLAGGRLPAGHRRGPAHRAGGERCWPPGPGPARPRLGRGGGGPAAARRTGACHRRGPSGSAQPGRNRQSIILQRCCSFGGSARGGRSARSADLDALDRARAAAADGEQGTHEPGHHRRAAAGEETWVYGRAGSAMPTVWDHDPQGRAGRTR